MEKKAQKALLKTYRGKNVKRERRKIRAALIQIAYSHAKVILPEHQTSHATRPCERAKTGAK